MDRAGADPSSAGGDGTGTAMAAVFVAAATDPVLGRGLARFWNLLASAEDLLADSAYTTRVMEVMADPDAYPVPDRVGPSRRELLAALEAERTPV
jgi:hypothetical protein